MSSIISTTVSQLITIAKDDAAKSILPALAAFLTSMAATPTKINLAVQLVQLDAAVVKALPQLETDELMALANILTKEITALLTPAATATATAAAAKPA